MFGKHNWVCTICGQGFTRKHSGNRHNTNLHSGTAKLVRPFDYVIGRLNGEIASPMHDPSFYRRYKGKSYRIVHEGNIMQKLQQDHHPHQTVHNNKDNDSNAYRIPQSSSFPIYRQPLRKTTNDHITNSDNDNKPDDNLNKIQNRSSKFEELKTLLYKYCRPQDAYRILTVVNFQMALDRNERFLDAALKQFHDFDNILRL
jgi:hypothetical protein